VQLAVFDQSNASHLLGIVDADASVYDVTIVDDLVGKQAHGQ